MILPVPSASLSISSHSMTCKLQNSVPSLATESGTSVWRHHRHPMARCKANFGKELRSLNDMPSMMQLPCALFFAKEWRGSPRVFQPQWLRGSGRHNPAHCKYNIIQ